MSRTKLFSAAFLSILAPALAFAQTSSVQASLKLLPAPKEVRLGKDTFAVTSTSRILVEAAYAAEDRTAAEWDDDGETLFEMTWPALAFGATAGWQPGESVIDDFKNSYDWAFYRNPGDTFKEVLENLDRWHAALKNAGSEGADDTLFWAAPFSEDGAKLMQKALPAARDVRLGAEHALEALYRNRAAARANADTLDGMIFAAWRLDALDMKIQFTSEISHFYWDAYEHLTDGDRVENDLEEMTAIKARLEDLRDATTRLRGMYEKAWLCENRPYWLANVLVRYDLLAQTFQGKIVAVRDAQRQHWMQKTLPPPQQLGFYLQP